MFKLMHFTFAILICAYTISFANGEETFCKSNEKSLTLLNLMKETVLKVKDLHTQCNTSSLSAVSENKCFCDLKQKSSAYVDVVVNLIRVAEEKYHICNDQEDTGSTVKQRLPTDCQDIQRRGQNISGVYTVYPVDRHGGRIPMVVYCDMVTDGGGWTVIQRRVSGKVNFYRDWNTYRRGFGNIQENFWLGNDNIFFLTNQADYSVRFDMKDETLSYHRYATYEYFRIENEEKFYKLHILGYSGDAGNAMERNNNMLFSTKDEKHDTWSDKRSCGEYHESGWWFYTCSTCNPNGNYDASLTAYKHINWDTWKGDTHLGFMEIKLRRSCEI